MERERELEGLRGWLVLVGLGVVLTPIKIIVMTIMPLFEIIDSGLWAEFTTPGSEAYHALWKPVIIGEIVVNCVLCFGWIVAVVKYFGKSRSFPFWYITLSAAWVVFMYADALAGKAILPEEPLFDARSLGEFIGAIVSSVIWIWYMLVSRRVKATFVY
jgi:hypothetical protein